MQIDSLPPAQQARLRAPLTRGLDLAEAFLRTSRAEMLDPARFEELDCGAVLHQAIDDAFLTAREKSVRLVRALPDDPLWINGEFGLLHRAMLNLILNAIHHAPAGSAVELALRAVDGRAEVSVTDSGPGISDADQTRLFQRFSRTAQAGGGTGLGLYFVRTVAEKHGGGVNVRTASGGPTCFTLSLPRVQH